MFFFLKDYKSAFVMTTEKPSLCRAVVIITVCVYMCVYSQLHIWLCEGSVG